MEWEDHEPTELSTALLRGLADDTDPSNDLSRALALRAAADEIDTLRAEIRVLRGAAGPVTFGDLAVGERFTFHDSPMGGWRYVKTAAEGAVRCDQEALHSRWCSPSWPVWRA